MGIKKFLLGKELERKIGKYLKIYFFFLCYRYVYLKRKYFPVLTEHTEQRESKQLTKLKHQKCSNENTLSISQQPLFMI